MAKTRSAKSRTLEPGIPDSHYTLIGELMVEWSRLETVLSTLIWHFLNLDMEDGRTITATLDARPKVRMLRKLVKRHVKPKKNRDLILNLLEVAEGLQEDRNFIAHGIWSTAMPDNVPAASSLRPKSHPFHVVTEAFTAERMREIIKLTCDVTDALYDAPGALAASQKKHDARLLQLKTSQKRSPKDHSP